MQTSNLEKESLQSKSKAIQRQTQDLLEFRIYNRVKDFHPLFHQARLKFKTENLIAERELSQVRKRNCMYLILILASFLKTQQSLSSQPKIQRQLQFLMKLYKKMKSQSILKFALKSRGFSKSLTCSKNRSSLLIQISSAMTWKISRESTFLKIT